MTVDYGWLYQIWSVHCLSERCKLIFNFGGKMRKILGKLFRSYRENIIFV